MKKINYLKILAQLSFLAIVLFASTENVYAQKANQKDGMVEHKDSERPCIVVNLDPEPKPLKKAWKSFLKDNYDFKIKGIGFLSNKDLLYAEDVVIEAISTKRMDFYTKIVEDEVGSEMKVFGSFGYDIYIDKKETPEEYAVMNQMLTSFLESYLPKYYKSKVKATKKKVKELSKDVKSLKKDISKNKEEIEDLSEEIGELTNEATEKESELTIANNKLQERIQKLERIKSKFKK
jgi:peptidoglycan hydrolase CwlO-like protein